MSEPRRLTARIFMSANEPRLRAGWRLCLNLILIQVFSLLAYLPFIFIQLPSIPLSGGNLLSIQIAALAAITGSVFICRRWLDRRSIASLGLQLDRRAGIDLLAGFLIAGAMMSLIFLIESAAGWLKIGEAEISEPFNWGGPLALGAMLIAFVATGWQEELYFRGYLLQNLRDGLNIAWAVGSSSVIFSLAHLANPNLSIMGVLGLTLAGLFMAYGYLRTGQLWLPIGLHIGWNFFEGPVFGFPVSGLKTFQLLPIQVSGPELFTGGRFGPEAGLVLLPSLALGIFFIHLFYRRQLRKGKIP